MASPTSLKPKYQFGVINAVLVLGFTGLIVLIWLIGTVSTTQINSISTRAAEQADAYNRRVTAALNIRESAARIVAEARLARSRRDLRVPVPPFRIKLTEAKLQLEQSMKVGSQYWDAKPDDNNQFSAVSTGERTAWETLKGAERAFQHSLNEFDPSTPPNPSLTASPEPSPTPVATPTATPQSSPLPQSSSMVEASPTPDPLLPGLQADSQFLDARSRLDVTAASLTEAVNNARQAALDQFIIQQQQAADQVNHSRWSALLAGLVVAFVALVLVNYRIVMEQRAMHRAQVAEGRERSVTDSQRNYILVINQQGALDRVNQAFLDHFKITEGALVAQDYHAALAHLPEVNQFVEEALAAPPGQGEQRRRVEVKTEPGTVGEEEAARLFDVNITDLTIENETRGRVVVLDDITEIEHEREVYRRGRTLSAVGQITAQVAHELYNPIGAVKLNLDLLEMQTGPDEDVKHTVGRLKRAVDHLSTIVMDLRYLTKPREPERKQVDLNYLLDDVVELASDRLERTRVRVVREYASALPQGNYDPQQLRKVFLNLLINAVEASPQNGEIELRTQVLTNTTVGDVKGHGRACEVSIIDHGTGMSPETKRRLFEAFYTTKQNGTGLGMMITQEIIKKHGGQIEVESEEGKGTTVNVKLPL